MSGSNREEQSSLLIAIIITGGITTLEIVGGILSNSLALASDAWHMFNDTSSLMLCYIASRIIPKPPTKEKTFGYFRVDVISAFVNGLTLLAVVVFIFLEGVLRIFYPAEVKGMEMLIITIIGLFANILSMTVLRRTRLSLNVRAAFLHVLTDTLSSVGVLGAALIIYYTHVSAVDAVMGIVIGLVVFYGTVGMLRQVVHILLEGVPPEMGFDDVVDTIKSAEGVKGVHDLHIWSITSYVHYMTAHLVIGREDIEKENEILNDVKRKIQSKYRIRNTTFQVEIEGYKEVGEVHR